jgi:hypothetical protein
MMAAIVREMQPPARAICATKGCGEIAEIEGLCRECDHAAWEQVPGYGDEGARPAGRLKDAAYLAAVIGVIWLLVWETRDFWIGLAQLWLRGDAWQ